MNPKFIRGLFQGGAVAMSFVVSLAVYPPALTAKEHNAINVENFFVLAAGVLSLVVVYKQSEKLRNKKLAIGLMVLLLVLMGLYQVLYLKYSVVCPQTGNVIVISHAPVKDDKIANLEFWENLHPGEGVRYLVDANFNSALNVWNERDIYPPYFALITVYLLIVIVFTALISVSSEIALSSNPKKQEYGKENSDSNSG